MLLFGIGTVLIEIIMIALTLVFTPENTHPAYDAAMTLSAQRATEMMIPRFRC